MGPKERPASYPQTWSEIYCPDLSIKELKGRSNVYGDHVRHLTYMISFKALKNLRS